VKLLVDLGNTRGKWQLLAADGMVAAGTLEAAGFDSLQTKLEAVHGKVDEVWVSSVVDDTRNELFARWCGRALGLAPRFAKVAKTFAGLTVAYTDVGRLGVDRWLAMLAACNDSAGPCVVVDAGSAITVDCVDTRGQHMGGLIVPGIRLMRESLFQQTSAVKVEALSVPAAWQPGASTIDCVANGISAMLQGFVQQVLAAEASQHARIFLTGGDRALLSQWIEGADQVQREFLVLEGLDVFSRADSSANTETKRWP
jgi:type III pantothenate kinase